jgi:predicted oxidoreductase
MHFAATEKYDWLHKKDLRFFPVVGWAERGGYGGIGHGNSVPRFHITWGTGPGVVERHGDHPGHDQFSSYPGCTDEPDTGLEK